MASSNIQRLGAADSSRKTWIRRLRFERLEDRELLFAAGTYSQLCHAILDANAHPNSMGQDYIYITTHILLGGALPQITEGVEIRATNPRYVIDGNGGSFRGFDVSIPTAGLGDQWATVTIRDLELRNFSSSAVNIERNVNRVTVSNCVIHHNNGAGVHLATTEDATSVQILGSFVFNNGVGISHYGHADTFNVTSSMIGAWQTAYPTRGNGASGVYVGGTGQLTISGSVISGNGGNGITIVGTGNDTQNLTIQNSKIGVDETGGYSLPNGQNGIDISAWGGQGAGNLTIYGNVISGNTYDGIEITGTATNTQNLIISGNHVDLNGTGTAGLPNGQNGIDVCGWHGPAAGWTSQIYNNKVGVNGFNGVSLNDCHDIAVISNTITSNQRNGILLSGTTDDIWVGAASHGNTIVWNGSTSSYHGICLADSVSSVSIFYNGFASNFGKAIATSSASNHNIRMSENAFSSEGIAPISLHVGSNHGIHAPAIDVPGIIHDGSDWIVPVSVAPCGAAFAGQPLRIEFYKYNSATDAFTLYATATGGAFDAQGGFSGEVRLPTASLAAGEQIAAIVICTGGATIGDTSEFSAVITIDHQAPRIVNVVVRNPSAWDAIETTTGNTQLIPVKLDGGVNQVTITFDRPIDNDDFTAVRNALTVAGHDGAWPDWPGATSVSFSGDRKEITWTFGGGPYIEGEMILVLSASAIETNDVDLDGDWTSPEHFADNTGNSTFNGGGHSGNGTAGGDFVFNFTLPNTLPGDANRDGKVDDLDASILAAHWQMTGGATWSDADFNGDGNVNDLDASILASHWQATCWPEPEEEQLLWGGGSLSSSRSALDAIFARDGFAYADSSDDIALGSAEWSAFMSEWLAAMAA